jgi:hypothetical protein
MTVLLFTNDAEHFADPPNTVLLTAGSLNHEELRDVDKLKEGEDFRVYVTS